MEAALNLELDPKEEIHYSANFLKLPILFDS
jgi:hypothetical protein